MQSSIKIIQGNKIQEDINIISSNPENISAYTKIYELYTVKIKLFIC